MASKIKKSVVIIGGGFAGTTVASHLDPHIPEDWQVILLSKENYITFNPLLAEVVGASIPPSHVVAPIRQMVKNVDFRMVNVTDIDLQTRTIYYLGEGGGSIEYDQLVLACGNRANLDLIPGMGDYALPLKTVGDALFLRNRITVRLEQAELQQDAEARRWLTTFIVIGGGFSGVEIAGEIDDFLHVAIPYYPNLRYEDCKVILLHAMEHLLPELPPKLGDAAQKRMRKHIDIRVNSIATRVDDRGVELKSDERVNGGTIICTIGNAPSHLIDSLPLPKNRGRLETNPDMSVKTHPGIWAIGDCAIIPNEYDGQLAPPTAQFAVREGMQLANNLIRRMAGNATKPFHYKPIGMLASIGHYKAVAEIMGLHISGFIAWLLWRAVYLAKIPTLARKVRLFGEWNWQLLFARDIVHMHYQRTKRAAPIPSSNKGNPTVIKQEEISH